jgi:hypothetical protein
MLDTAGTNSEERPVVGERADAYEDLKPLNALIRAGKLYAVADWLKAGRPVNLPRDKPKRANWKSPLRTAMDTGFHSLIELLLKKGAELAEPHGYYAFRETPRYY